MLKMRRVSITAVVYDSNMRPAGLKTFTAADPDLTGCSRIATPEELDAPDWKQGCRADRRRSSIASRAQQALALQVLALQEPQLGSAWTQVEGQRRGSWSNRHVRPLSGGNCQAAKRRPIVFPRSGGARATPAWMLAVWDLGGNDSDEDQDD
eukprot:GHVU01202888.1.p1 GENE.GHVU01202888.1~~GHVU01202888.1.p1  ORF type:complete len:152 (+),score=14.02 GHVU01202888.1:74-529(+)